MPALIGPFVGFALGAVLAWLGRMSSDPPDLRGVSRPTALATLFAGLVFTPVCAYFVVFAGDWSLAYLVDSRSIPSAALLILILADGGSVVAGSLIARGFARRRSLRGVATLAAAPLAASVLFVLICYARLRVDGTYLQVRGDFGTQPVAGGPLGYALLWMHGVLALGFVFTVRLLRDRPRSSTAAPIRPPPPPRPPAALPGPRPRSLTGRAAPH